ncbi:MAG: Dyp-type peroxidase, partial [Novosphingobium sp.]
KREGSAHPYADVQKWLAGLIADDLVSFGDKPPQDFVCNIAFSAAGLRLLGLDKELALEGPGTEQGFPPAFSLGMAHASRKRALGDPDQLEWCDHETHVVLLLYASDEDSAEKFAQIVADAAAIGITQVASIRTGLKSFDLKRFELAWENSDDSVSAPADAPGFVHAKPSNDDLSEEPFGFVDGVSQPLVRGFPGRHGAPDPVHGVEPGEFILGYTDNRGYYPPSPLVERPMRDLGMLPEVLLPSPPPDQPTQYPDFADQGARSRDFGRNGSYLVIRQLAQDVDGFRKQLDEKAHEICKQPDVINPHNGNIHRTREWIAAKMLGRWRDGSALIDNPFHPAMKSGVNAMRKNDFLYKDADPQGLRCPFGSHVRRTFPRDSLAPTEPVELSVSNRHRLLRRGRPYLDNDGDTARGTLFMAFNADLERQFEFVQQTWLASPTFHGLESEPDPFAMHKGPTESATQRFTILGRNAPLELCPVQRYVTLKGGGYFFLPGRHALWFLAGAALDTDRLHMS